MKAGWPEAFTDVVSIGHVKLVAINTEISKLFTIDRVSVLAAFLCLIKGGVRIFI